MSKPSRRFTAPAVLLVAALVPRLVSAAEAPASEPRVDAYVTTDKTPYFALSLSPNVAVTQGGPRNVVIVFDTSASQTGVFRENGLDALTVLLQGLNRADRVRLLAVDLEAVGLSPAFAAPKSDETLRAMAALQQRAPLGATDLPEALRAAAASFDAKSKNPRVLVYLGDGMSAARLMVLDAYRHLVDALVGERISVSSYAVGPRVDSALLAALANATGGMLAIDGETATAKQCGAFLAAGVRGTVIWPTQMSWPKVFVEVYPSRMPPLRTDRDTIVLGKSAAGKLSGELTVAMTADVGGKSQAFQWTLAAGASNPDFAFLPVLVEGAKADGGARLITLGSPGLKEARRILNSGTELLGKLARQALVSGNRETAERLADEALRRDPNDESSLSVKQQLAKMRDGQSVAAQSEEKLEVKRFSSEQAAPPKSVPPAGAPLVAVAPSEPIPPPVGDVNDGEGRLLADVEQHNRLITDLLRAQVENELRQARAQMSTNPQGTEQSLKMMLERVVRSPELKAEVRAQLRGQLEATLREAARRGATKDIIDQQREEARGADRDRAQIAEGLMRDQEKIVQLMERFNSLMAEGRYVAADQIGEMEVARIAPNLPIAQSASLTAHMTGAHQADLALRMARQKAVVDTLATVEVALMPFPDDQPVVYPPADIWEEIYYRRKKYAESSLKSVTPAEAKIQKALTDQTKVEVIETPLQNVVTYLKELHDIEIQLDRTAMADAGADPEGIVTLSVNGISLKAALRLLLRPMDLTYIVRDEVLLITTKDVADTALVPKAYPVGDLVIPVQSLGGGMGGGMMGGGMMGGGGGMMGGGGGMMGGGGGMMGGGGGMMGGGGGMGGGMFSVPDALRAVEPSFQAFAVPDDLKLTPKSKSAPTKSAAPNGKPAAVAPAKAPRPVAALPSKPTKKVAAIELSIPAGADPQAVWSAYFAAHQDVSPAAVRQTARQLMNGHKFAELIGMIQAALRGGQPQPWMYESLALAMQAAGSSKPEIERALMSAVDFGENADELLYVAQYLARSGLASRALSVFHQVTLVEPLRPEPYLYGLQLAQRLGDLEGIKWSSLGILKQAWPKEKRAIVERAKRAAAAAVEQLKAENRIEEAKKLQAEIDQAAIRDCIVKVTWTGDANVDILVQEPSGAVCAFRNPRTSGGGVLLGDSTSQDTRAAGEGTSETYECPQAFSGTYRVIVRRVWGKITAGKVTVDLYAYSGTPKEKHLRQQIPLGDQDALVVFDLPEGRRQEPLAEHQLANAAAGQLAVNQAILAQQVNQIANSTDGGNASLGASRQGLVGVPFINQAVGYQPVITVIPAGTQFLVSGVVSADRRYVRISPAPIFTGVSSVTTFNLITGSGGTTGGGGTGVGGF